jgi:hypothetical protein
VGEIDLTRFSKSTEAILPIVQGWGKYHHRLIRSNIEDGWYKFTLAEDAICQRKATLLEVEQVLATKKTLSGYCYGEEIIPVSFQNFFSRGLGETVRVFFLDREPWDVVKVTQWDDERFYYRGMDFAYRSIVNSVRSAWESSKAVLNVSGCSPELKYYYLLLSLERDTWRHLAELERLHLSEEEKKKRAEEFRLNFAERIRLIIEHAGGVFVSAMKQANNRYLVTWRVRGSRQQVKSLIRDNLRIEHAGYCLSGHDSEHDLNSIVPLAKTYIEDSGSLYLTRV